MRLKRFAFALILLLASCASQETALSPNQKPPAPPATCTFCPAESSTDCALCVVSNPLLTVDKDGAASGVLRLCNRGKQPATLDLDVSDFEAKGPEGAPYALAAVRTLTAASATDVAVVTGKTPLAVDACVDVKVDATKIWQAGLSIAKLRNRATPQIEIKAIRYQVPFNLKVEGPTPEIATVQFTRGREDGIQLRNEDPMAYRFLWSLELGGETIDSGEKFVRANGLVRLPITLPSSKFSFFESGFLRSGDRTGTLTLTLEPDASFSVLPLPQKRYPVNARLAFFSETVQRIMNYAWVLVVLLVGIVVSLLINHALPLQKKRVEIKLRLAAQEGRLSGLGGVVDSRILNLLRVEKKRLREALRDLQALVPQTAVELPKLEARIEWLIQRVDLTSGAGDLLEAIDTGSSDLALPEAETIRDHCREVLQIVEKTTATAEEIQEAKKHISLAATVLDGADKEPSDAAVQELKARAAEVLKGVPDELTTPAWEPFKQLFPSLTRDLLPQAVKMVREVFVRQAILVSRAELIREFVKHVDSSPSDAVRTKRLARAAELVTALQPGPEESIRRARDIVRQVEQNVTKADLIERIRACNAQGYLIGEGEDAEPKRAMWIEVDPPTPFTYQHVTFRVRFDRSALDCAVAQSEVQCKWMVALKPAVDAEPTEWADVDIPGAVTERRVSGNSRQPSGWLIGSYFVGERELQRAWRKMTASSPVNVVRKAVGVFRKNAEDLASTEDEETPFMVRAEFPDLKKEIISEPVTLERTRAYVESRTVLAAASLVITILIVAFGLLAGAQEKLQTLDWVSGVIAILVLGFGADTLKNLITRT